MGTVWGLYGDCPGAGESGGPCAWRPRRPQHSPRRLHRGHRRPWEGSLEGAPPLDDVCEPLHLCSHLSRYPSPLLAQVLAYLDVGGEGETSSSSPASTAGFRGGNSPLVLVALPQTRRRAGVLDITAPCCRRRELASFAHLATLTRGPRGEAGELGALGTRGEPNAPAWQRASQFEEVAPCVRRHTHRRRNKLANTRAIPDFPPIPRGQCWREI